MPPRSRMVSCSDHSPWWIRPDVISIVLVFPLLLAALLVSDEFHGYFRRPQKTMTFMYFMIGMAGLLCFWFGAFLGSKIRVRDARSLASMVTEVPAFRAQLILASRVILTVTLLGYFLYMWPIFANPRLLINILAGDFGAEYISAEMRERVRIPGVTSIAQLAILYVVLLVFRRVYLPDARIAGAEWMAFGVLIGLALTRSIAYSERLALIELLVPIVVLLCRRARLPRSLLAVAPIIAVIGLFVFFGTLEYFRSWQNYYQYIENDFLTFVASRFFGYYVTALDNGAGFLHFAGGGVGPIITFTWLWAFPVDFGQDTILRQLGFDLGSYDTFLYYFASEEFNNGGGLFGPFIDYGVIGGVFCWLIIGFLSGRLFRSYADGGFLGLILYPSWYTSILEIPRIFLFSGTRYFPALVTSLGLVLWFFIQKRLTIISVRPKTSLGRQRDITPLARS